MEREVYLKKLSDIKACLSGAKLLIVSKNRTPEEIKNYYDLGQRDFGENRVQELTTKAELLKTSCPEIRWHMIGHLQSNKVNHLFLVPNLVAIHSVHDQHLLDKLIHGAEKLTHSIDLFLQVNASHEEEKSGFETYTDLRSAAETLIKCHKLIFRGLMTMGKIRTEAFEAEARRCFQELQVEKDKLEAEFDIKLETSMGMSQDYKIALEEGTSWVRLGTMMFE